MATSVMVLGTLFLGVCGIILCGGLVGGKISWFELMMGTGCLVFLAGIFHKLAKSRAEEGSLSQDQARLLEQRLAEVERRLADIQEVVLAIDEKLEHLEVKQGQE